jgi:hypothetical protein
MFVNTGSLVKHQLVSSITLGHALRCVLDALRKPLDSKVCPPGFSFWAACLFVRNFSYCLLCVVLMVVDVKQLVSWIPAF